MEIKTKDLWEGAYIMAEGGELGDLRIDHSRGKKEIIFILRGQEIEDLSREYQSGKALCNVTRLRACMNHLRDLIFRRV